MKNKYFIWIAAALLLIIGCTKNEIVNEQPTPEVEGRKLLITASVPSESPKTRLNLEWEDGTLNIITKWQVGYFPDVINFFFKQNTVIKEGTPVTLTQDAISADGKSACFTVNIPEGIDTQNAYTIYAVHGASDVYLDTENSKINVMIFPLGFVPLHVLIYTPIVGEVEIAAGASIGNINFEHLGAYQCLTIKNASAADFKFIPTYSSLVNVGGTIWYYNYSVEAEIKAPVYDLIGKQVTNEYTMEGLPNMSITLYPGLDIGCQVVQWVMPKDIPTPEARLKIVTEDMGLGDIYSDNIKPARASALQKGKAYHLFAVWDGTSLSFTDQTLTPTANPLSYVAEYNINPAGDSFVGDLTACNISGYFNYNNAVTQFGNIIIGGQRYHLPSSGEWCSIAPATMWVKYGSNTPYNNQSETVTVAGNIYTMTSDFRNHPSDTTTYALRYKGTHLVSAWKYEYTGKNTNNCHLKITSRSVYGQTITVDQIADASFWSANTENDVVRYFPASGNSKDPNDVGIGGAFWSSTSERIMGFRDTYAQSKSGYNHYGFSVRLFTSGN
jgi:hypothetical protein